MLYPKNATVRTTPKLLERHVFLVPKVNKMVRRPDSPGFVKAHFGATYLVLHPGETTPAVYEECELLPELAAYWVVNHPLEGIPYHKEFATYDEAMGYIFTLHGVETTMEGPFYSDKVLQEGPVATKTLFDHLTDDF